ncbi:MAG: SLBB domain-containing protein [Nitrospinae bacterium]|nr:SLBB domain-containing protein [Nitrospinota bacterium]
MNAVELVKKAGVVGAGGAGFPTHVKLAAKADTVLANGAECEPLLFSDQSVMLGRAAEIVDGLKTVMKAVGAERGIICVKEKNKEAVKALEKHLTKNISLFGLGNFYPAGDEQIMVYEATGRIVPEAGIPLNVGVVVQNVATLANIARAQNGEAVTSRIVTIGGEVKNPGVHAVPVGTPVADAIARCGGPLIENCKLLLNGPMMGRLGDPQKDVVTKTTSGIFLLPAQHPLVMRLSRPLPVDIRISRGACEQCRYCTDFCPRYLQGHALQPHKIMRVINEQREPEAETVTNSFLCCECGVCDLFACPIMLSPRRIFREFKKSLGARGVRFPQQKKEYAADIHRDYRRVPKDKLLRRLDVARYEMEPVFHDAPWEVDAVNIPMQMHLGAPATPVVKTGEKVKRGQLIAEIPAGKMGANVHASIGGTVTAVNGLIRIER